MSVADECGGASSEVPLAYTYHLTNNFHEWPTWHFPSLYDIYCVNYTIPGERNFLIGSIYIAQYLFYLSLYIPSLIVISRPPLINYACYKLMFAVGVLDNCVGFYCTFFAGVLSIMGANYCDNNVLLIVVGHMWHGFWFAYCMTGVLLAFNRYIELRSKALSKRLFQGRRCWLWLLAPLCYGTFLSSSIDLPPIYNSVWSVYLFQIDLREDAAPVNDWTCFSNSVATVISLTILYSMLLYELHNRSAAAVGEGAKHVSSMQKKVLFQSFLICFFLYFVACCYAVAGFIPIPLGLAKIATIAVQLCSGFTSIVYLVINDTVRAGVKRLLCGNRVGAGTALDGTVHTAYVV